jgi:hypothetical protein
MAQAALKKKTGRPQATSEVGAPDGWKDSASEGRVLSKTSPDGNSF